MFEHAILLDPGFALAHAGIAAACGLVYEWHDKEERWLERGRTACERALALDPSLPEALVGRARLYYTQHRYDDSIRDVKRAIELKKDCDGAYNILARSLFESDRWAEALETIGPALAVNGDDYNVYVPYTNMYEGLGRTEDAAKLREREIVVLEQQLKDVPEDVRARILLAADYAATGRQDEAGRELQKAVDLRPHDSNILYNAACTYGVMKKKPEALSMLRRAKDAGYVNTDWIRRDPDLAACTASRSSRSCSNRGRSDLTPSVTSSAACASRGRRPALPGLPAMRGARRSSWIVSSRTSSPDRPATLRIRFLAAAIAPGAPCSSSRTRAATAASSWSAGTTRWTSPSA